VEAGQRRWWASDSREIYWLETTDRPDVGVDLNAPEVNEEGKSYWSYDFVREVAECDLVFHYETPSERVAFWSRAVGQPYQAEVVWGAHGQASGRGPVAPYPRPGWRRPLDGPFPVSQPVTLRDLQAREDELARIYRELRERVGGSVYFRSSCLAPDRCAARRRT
jgi:hypothetical protein